MPAPSSLPVKICPFCMVDAHTDAASCAYCGSSYDQAGKASDAHDDVTHARRRTYDGTPRGARSEARCLSLQAY